MERTGVSIITPTFNSMRTLNQYLDAIKFQSYNHNFVELIIADGGSTDGTLEFLREYTSEWDIRTMIFTNPLVTAEAGKAVGVRHATHEIVCLLDSDNIIPDENWLQRMIAPFTQPRIVASEPISYTYRKQDSTVNRYCALIGMGDPLCLFLGNYDRTCLITNKWTQVECEQVDEGDYISVRFTGDLIPTIGANGFLMRKKELLENFDGDYLFDIDVLWELFQKEEYYQIAKVKTGIVHLFCPDIQTFYRKQRRRIKDYLFFSDTKGRKYPWKNMQKRKIVLFSLCCVTIIPLIVQSAIGFTRKRDAKAWLFHLPACWVTLWVYGWGTIMGLFKKEAASRVGWKQ